MPRDPQSRAVADAEQASQDASARAAADAFRISLPPLRPGEPPFEGPLDLILHLVKEHEVDLFDIPIARITESYLATLEALRELDIDIAGEFLHMAAQLMLMKSRLLLPRTEVAEDAPAEEAGVDPRAELVRRLLEYQKYKAAGEELGERDILERTVFVRKVRVERPAAAEGPEGLADVSVFKLIEALDRALKLARPEHTHEVETDRLTISDAIARVADVLRLRRRATFEELLAGPAEQRHTRSDVIATFLAILEMAKLKLVRIFQAPLDEAGPGAGDPRRGEGHPRRRRARARRGGLSMTAEFDDPSTPSAAPAPAGGVSEAELQAMQAAEDAKAGDPELEEVESAAIDAPGADEEKEEPFEKLAAAAKRLSADRVRTIVETLLFLAERPLSAEELRQATGVDVERLEKALDKLSGHYREGVCGIVLHEVAGGWQLRSSPDNSGFARRWLKVKPQRLTRAALETLAIIAYRQPVTRPRSRRSAASTAARW